MTELDHQTPVEACAGCLDRRTVLRGAGAIGAAAAGVGVLAACGSSAGQAASSAASQAVGSATDAAKNAVKSAQVPVGGGKVLTDAKVVITQPTSGQFKAFSAVCTHQGCIVADVSGGTINCGCHGSQYDIATGAVKRGPATAPLAPKSVKVGADGITVT
ncbi:Rieske (2Fe-2S) protein [Oryzihumus leptocrescens]|uniref:Cytochrome bc1 complex Rieske iron-sulfur subunit n=1 Tax=Oryzihumus leptocrescens TaxID=297536 RepID=A0A542ZJX3_9MICO|nr:Rieske (2Fe-2S) protein [Oryzihumus leptocrescens]TQL60652.1 Rieske Fe-S protein [Oryzihumus leptocrescens]